MIVNDEPIFVDPDLLQKAAANCTRRLAGDPENRVVLRSLAEVHRKMGNLQEAARVYGRIFHLDPVDADAAYMQAMLGGTEWSAAPAGIHAVPFVLLRDFLPAEFHDKLLPFMIASQGKFVHALITPENEAPRYDRDARETLDLAGQTEDKQRFREHLAGVLPGVFRRLHVAPARIAHVEVSIRAYQDGHFFRLHKDVPQSTGEPLTGDSLLQASRIASFVYYFHRVPRPFEGGGLLLFDGNRETDEMNRSGFTQIVPEDNALVIFPSNAYHCVVPVRCASKDFGDSRFVINGFVHGAQ